MNASMLLGLLTLLLGGFVGGTSVQDDEELQKRIAARRPTINKLKTDGKVGEVWDGYIEAVKSSHLEEQVTVGGEKITVETLLDEENADRKKVYEIIAKKQKTAVSAVARIRGEKEFETAATGVWLKGKDGWFEKKKKEEEKKDEEK